MTDTITESFCERCGTRYSFDQNAEHRRGRVGRVRILTRGLKNYVANDGMPMNEAMAAAEHDEARAGVSRQLDAFHKAFNFCMSCRQYTCASCWNGKVGECLTCAPDLSRDVLPALFPDLPLGGPVHGDGPAPDDRAPEPEAWPTADLARITAASAAAAAPAARPTGAAEAGAGLATPAPSDAPPSPDAPVSPEAGVTAAAAVPDEDLTAAELAAVESALATGHPVVGPPVAPEAEAPSVAAAEPEPAPAPAAEPEAEPAPIVKQVAETATPEAEPEQAPAPAAEPAAEATTVDVATITVPPAAVEPAERVTAAQQQTRSLLRRFRPAHRAAGPDAAAAAVVATAAIKQDEGAPAFAQPDAEPEAAPAIVDVAADTEPEPVSAPAAEPELAPEPHSPAPAPDQTAAAAPEPTVPPVVEPASPPTDAAAPVDAIEQPTWRVMAPEAPATPALGWPDAPAWPARQPDSTQAGPLPGPATAPWASRLATARPEPTNVWAASSQEVLAAPDPSSATRPGAPAVQACVSCGLSLSANARFCRRCGSRQG